MFDAKGRERLPGHLVRAEGSSRSEDPDVNGAFDNVGITLQFLSEVFGRHSLDGHGMDVHATVHYGDRFSNAMWDGRQMLFGDGDGVHIRGFTQSLDIVAHELTHAVTQHAIPRGLGVVERHGKPDLAGEAGALNESISDVFASLVKQWHRRQDVHRADWLLGEGILAPALGSAIRSLAAPGNTSLTYEGDHQVAHLSAFVKGGDVHANSGIPNHAFYLCATALGGHAWEHAGQIWYESIPLLHAKSDFAEGAAAMVETAKRLFGASREQQAVHAAWRKVGVRAA